MEARLAGQLIRADRLARRLTQREVAEAVGVKSTTVMRWESGQHAPDEDHAESLAAYFGEPVERYFTPPADWQETQADRVARLELEVRDLRERIAALSAAVEKLGVRRRAR